MANLNCVVLACTQLESGFSVHLMEDRTDELCGRKFWAVVRAAKNDGDKMSFDLSRIEIQDCVNKAGNTFRRIRPI